MANFPPLKNYILFCLDKMVSRWRLTPPFLDVGCGVGDVAQHLSGRGWQGTAIDISEKAIQEACARNREGRVRVERASVFDVKGEFQTVLAMDILEHIDRDEDFLLKVKSLLSEKGNLVLAVPSNAKEWRWDDDFYGHVRRYSREDLAALFARTGFRMLEVWDFTFPFFWILRRVYTRCCKPRLCNGAAVMERTVQSSTQNAWPRLRYMRFIIENRWLWKMLFLIQYHCFRNRIKWGHEMIVLAEKKD